MSSGRIWWILIPKMGLAAVYDLGHLNGESVLARWRENIYSYPTTTPIEPPYQT